MIDASLVQLVHDPAIRMLDYEHRWILIELLVMEEKMGALPNDPAALATALGLHGRTFNRLWRKLQPFFNLTENVSAVLQVKNDRKTQAKLELNGRNIPDKLSGAVMTNGFFARNEAVDNQDKSPIPDKETCELFPEKPPENVPGNRNALPRVRSVSQKERERDNLSPPESLSRDCNLGAETPKAEKPPLTPGVGEKQTSLEGPETRGEISASAFLEFDPTRPIGHRMSLAFYFREWEKALHLQCYETQYLREIQLRIEHFCDSNGRDIRVETPRAFAAFQQIVASWNVKNRPANYARTFVLNFDAVQEKLLDRRVGDSESDGSRKSSGDIFSKRIAEINAAFDVPSPLAVSR